MTPKWMLDAAEEIFRAPWDPSVEEIAAIILRHSQEWFRIILCARCGCKEEMHETIAYHGDKPRACLDCHSCSRFVAMEIK